MALIRWSTMVTFAVAVAYYGLHALATQCLSLQCDVYIGPSLLLPILLLGGAVLTGIVALTRTRARPQGPWRGLLGGATVLSVVGPIVSLAVFRDSRDAFVPVATVLVVLTPLCALIYSLMAPASYQALPTSQPTTWAGMFRQDTRAPKWGQNLLKSRTFEQSRAQYVHVTQWRGVLSYLREKQGR